MTAWKNLELRVCRMFGGERAGPTGKGNSDCVGVPYSIEIKRSLRGVPEGAWLQQARSHGQKEKKPWLLVVAGHNDRKPIVTLELSEFLRVARLAGVLTTELEVQ